MEYRIEKDTMGEVQVPSDMYYGAQTQRSYDNFKISEEKMPSALIHSIALVKKACAITNASLGTLTEKVSSAIVTVCDEIISGKLEKHFVLSVWQTGSGTQTNMNLNEVIANRANELLGEKLVHPNDDVNKSQSSNDVFPTAMHICCVSLIKENLLSSIDELISTLEKKSKDFEDIIKTGRTHLQDAVPLSLGSEISAWAEMLISDRKMILDSLDGLYRLAIGGTAVGTGLNAPKGFSALCTENLAKISGYDFVEEANKFYSLSSKGAVAFSHSALKTLATDLMKIANDVRWLSSGPRCGIGEIVIPSNEPGSSIMPGKVNPTQPEALNMVALQVLGNDTTISFASATGNFQLNVNMPVIIYNFVQSVNLLSDSMHSFNKNCAVGIMPNYERISENLNRSLMVVTALNPAIGYEKSAKVAKKAFSDNISLKDSAVSLGYLTEEEYDRLIDFRKMI